MQVKLVKFLRAKGERKNDQRELGTIHNNIWTVAGFTCRDNSADASKRNNTRTATH